MPAASDRRRRDARLRPATPDEQLALEFEPGRLCAGCVNSCKQHEAIVVIGCAKYVSAAKKAER